MLIFLTIKSLPNRRTSGGAELSATALSPADVLRRSQTTFENGTRTRGKTAVWGTRRKAAFRRESPKNNPFRKDIPRHFSENGLLAGGAAKKMDQELRRALAWKVLGVGVLVAGVVLGASLCRGAEKKRASRARISSNRPVSIADRTANPPSSYPPIPWHACYEYWTRFECARRSIVAAGILGKSN